MTGKALEKSRHYPITLLIGTSIKSFLLQEPIMNRESKQLSFALQPYMVKAEDLTIKKAYSSQNYQDLPWNGNKVFKLGLGGLTGPTSMSMT